MSLYDQLAFSDFPILYLSTIGSGDLSLSGTYTITGTLNAEGQPIVSGHQNSFMIDSTTNVTFSSGSTSYSNIILELVAKLEKPTVDIPLLTNQSNGSGIFINAYGIYVKVLSVDGRSNIVSAPIVNWNDKQYVTVYFSDIQVELNVNGLSYVISYSNDPLDVVSNMVMSNIPSGYVYLIDGIGIYYRNITGKISAVDDKGQGYQRFSSIILAGASTLFETIKKSFSTTINKNRFTRLTNGFCYYYQYSHQNDSYLVITTNSRLPVYYNTNNNEWNVIDGYAYVAASDIKTIGFLSLNNIDFDVTITGIMDGNVQYHSPAIMQLTGYVYPLMEQPDECIVNIPSGVDLSYGSYYGSWITGDVMTNNPSSIEIVFMPMSHDLTYIFSNNDGFAACGSGGGIGAYTAYLNGQSVTDLDNVLVNQWNHLVLVKSSTSDQHFYLNNNSSASSPKPIKYMSLAAYQSQLTPSQITQLYSILIGLDSINVSENNIAVTEGTAFNGGPFNVYSYAWAIVGAGGQ